MKERKRCNILYIIRMITLFLFIILIPLHTNANGKEVIKLPSNIGSEDYTGWGYSHSSPIRSYMLKTPGGYRLVWASATDVSFVDLNENFAYISQKKVISELPIFGGFFEGKDAYYIAFGDSNPNESDAKEVIRVVKYDKNLNRIAHTSCFGLNTYIPFDAGSLRMAESDGVLYLRTSHEMYAGSGEVHHQSNLTIQINEENMSLITSFHYVYNIDGGYVSHSFNQFIIVDDEKNIVALDQGDANPRSAVLGRYRVKAGMDPFYNGIYDYVDIVEYPETSIKSAYNYTGAALGGLIYSESKYLTVGYCGPLDSFVPNCIGNVYVSSTDRNNFTSDGTKVTFLSNYAQNGTITPCVPFIIDIGNNQFLVMWEERVVKKKENEGIVISDPERDAHNDLTGQIVVVKVNEDGKAISSLKKINGHLSDCSPIYFNGNIYWFTSDSKLCDINVLSVDTLAYQKKTISFPVSVELFDGSMEKARATVKRFGNFLYDDSDSEDFDKDLENILVTHNGTVLIKDVDYTAPGIGKAGTSYSEGELCYVQYFTIDVTGMGDYYGKSVLTAFPVRTNTVTSSIRSKKNGICIGWERELGALGYLIERTASDGSPVQKTEITEDGKFVLDEDDSFTLYNEIKWTDRNVKPGVKYTYSVKAFINDGTKFIYAGCSKKLSLKYEGGSEPEKVTLKSAKNMKKNEISVKWKKTSGINGYEIQYALDKKFKKSAKKKTVKSAKKTSLIIKKLKKGKTYYVRIRAYALDGKKKVYGKWSKTKKIKIKK